MLNFLAITIALFTAFFQFACGGWPQHSLVEYLEAGPRNNFSKAFIKSRFAPEPVVAGVKIEDKKPIKKVEAQDFMLAASSGLALDLNYNFYLFEKDADNQQPIASISKLMAALVFLDHNPGWNKWYTISEDDKRDGNKLNFFPDEQVLVRDLFYSALVASDNSAIISLARSTGLKESEFVDLMNSKAKALSMDKTNFVEPTGLSDNNISTARDVAKLVRAAMTDLDIKRAVLADKYNLQVLKNNKSVSRTIKNTDELLGATDLGAELIGGKTGYLNKAGYCFTGCFDKNNQEIITVVLGADTVGSRFLETKRLLDWVFNNYSWPN